MDEIRRIIERMEPEKALARLASAAKELLAHLDEDAWIDFVVGLTGEGRSDKVASMVNL